MPDCKGSTMFLLSVGWEEDHVQALADKTLAVFEANVTGPIKYRTLYEKYSLLLNGNAQKEKDEFLQSESTLDEFKDKMQQYLTLKKDILGIRQRALLNLFILDCTELNMGMIAQCQDLYDSLIKFQVNIVVKKLNLSFLHDFLSLGEHK